MNRMVRTTFLFLMVFVVFSCGKDIDENTDKKDETEQEPGGKEEDNDGEKPDEEEKGEDFPDFEKPEPYMDKRVEDRRFNANSHILTLYLRDVCHFGTIKELSNSFVKPGVFYNGENYTKKGQYVIAPEVKFAPSVLYFDDNTNVKLFSVDIENPNEFTIKQGIQKLVQENYNQETKARISQRIEEVKSISEINSKVGFSFSFKDFSLGSNGGHSLNSEKNTFLCEIEQIYYTLALFPKAGTRYYSSVAGYNSPYSPLLVNKIHFGRLFYLLIETEKTVGGQDISNALDYVIGKVSNEVRAREVLSKSRVHMTIYGGSSGLAQSTINGSEVRGQVGAFFSNPTSIGASNSLPISYGLVDATTGDKLDYVFINETQQEIKVEAQTNMSYAYTGGPDDWKVGAPMRYEVNLTTVIPMLPVKDITFAYKATGIINGVPVTLPVNSNDIKFTPQDFYLYNDIYVAKRKIKVTVNRNMSSYHKMHSYTIRIDASPIVLPYTTIGNRSLEFTGNIKYYVPLSVSILQ